MKRKSTSPSPHSLASFDYQFNGALDEQHVREIASAAFVKEGENLLVVGGRGTGKTVIAAEVCTEARRQGLSVSTLLPASTYSQCEYEELLRGAFGMVEDRYGSIGFEPSAVASLRAEKRHSRTELVDCDLLLVDEIESWLAIAPMQFRCLLARRIMLGRSTVLITGTAQWHWLLSSEATKRIQGASSYQRRVHDVLHFMPFDDGMDSLRGRLAADCTFADMLATLGVGAVSPDVPFNSKRSVLAGSAHGQQLLQALKLSAYTQRLGNRNMRDHCFGGILTDTPFWPVPVWHVLYTGENSPHVQRSADDFDS